MFYLKAERSQDQEKIYTRLEIELGGVDSRQAEAWKNDWQKEHMDFGYLRAFKS